MLEKEVFSGKFNDFRGFAGLHQYAFPIGKLGLEFLLPNSFCHLHSAAGGSRYFNDSDGPKQGNPKVFQGWLLEKSAFAGKFDGESNWKTLGPKRRRTRRRAKRQRGEEGETQEGQREEEQNVIF